MVILVVLVDFELILVLELTSNTSCLQSEIHIRFKTTNEQDIHSSLFQLKLQYCLKWPVFILKIQIVYKDCIAVVASRTDEANS